MVLAMLRPLAHLGALRVGGGRSRSRRGGRHRTRSRAGPGAAGPAAIVGGGGGGTAGGGVVACSSQAASARQAASAGARIERRDRIEIIEFSFVIRMAFSPPPGRKRPSRIRCPGGNRPPSGRETRTCPPACCSGAGRRSRRSGTASASSPGVAMVPVGAGAGAGAGRRVGRDRLRGVHGLRRGRRRVGRSRSGRVLGRRVRLRGGGRVAWRRGIARRVRARVLGIRRRRISRRIRTVGRRRRRGLCCAGVGRARCDDEERRPQDHDHGGCTH